MPFAQINKIRIHYEIYGAGDPVLMVGRDDIFTPPAFSRTLARLIPKGKLKIIAGGHGFFIEEAPAFNRAVLPFLRRVR